LAEKAIIQDALELHQTLCMVKRQDLDKKRLELFKKSLAERGFAGPCWWV